MLAHRNGADPRPDSHGSEDQGLASAAAASRGIEPVLQQTVRVAQGIDMRPQSPFCFTNLQRKLLISPWHGVAGTDYGSCGSPELDRNVTGASTCRSHCFHILSPGRRTVVRPDRISKTEEMKRIINQMKRVCLMLCLLL